MAKEDDLKKQLDAQQAAIDKLTATVEQLTAKVVSAVQRAEAAEKQLDAQQADATALEAVKADTKGVRRYVVGADGAFHRGALRKPGEVVTLQDGEVPSRTWRKLQDGEAAPARVNANLGSVDGPLKSGVPSL